jgi:hypothetical protein
LTSTPSPLPVLVTSENRLLAICWPFDGEPNQELQSGCGKKLG